MKLKNKNYINYITLILVIIFGMLAGREILMMNNSINTKMNENVSIVQQEGITSEIGDELFAEFYEQSESLLLWKRELVKCL